jgi:hypothetical protein
MSHLTEIEGRFGPGHEELIFPCDCSDQDYLRITWDDEDSDWRFLWIEHDHKPHGWNRVKSAVAALRGRVLTHGEIILTDESVDGLYEFLKGKIDGREQA